MTELSQIVDFYLTSDTTYALMISGKWGVGKTYYFKNVLAPRIRNTPTFKNASKKYKVITISLFGKNSIEDIQTEIFLSLYPFLKNKTVKLTASVGKALVKGMMKLKKLDEFTEYISEVDIDKEDWLNFNELVLCFDDFERLSPNLDLAELLGYINSLVENESVKIILLANQDQILPEEYAAMKEKVIGNSIEFIPNISDVYDSLIETKFAGSPVYLNFLKESKNFILEIFTRTSTNLRILKFALQYFHRVHSSFYLDLKKEDILYSFKEEILKKLLRFTLAISIEYKEGNITYSQNQDIDSAGFYDFDFSSPNGIRKKQKAEEEKSYREKFRDNYFTNENYNYFKSVYNFITGGTVISSEELLKELRRIYNISDEKILPQYEVLNILNYSNVFDLSESAYKKLTSEMVQFASQGLYDIKDYVTVFHFASRFNNPNSYNLQKLKNKIIRGMSLSIDTYIFTPNLDMYIDLQEGCENEALKREIKDKAMELNSSVNKRARNLEAKQIEDLYSQDFDKFFYTMLSNQEKYFCTPILADFDIKKFYRFFSNSSGTIQRKIIALFQSRYQHAYDLRFELKFLVSLLNLNTNKLQKINNTGINFFILNELQIVLERSIKKINLLDSQLK